jgi:hypothetical protein
VYVQFRLPESAANHNPFVRIIRLDNEPLGEVVTLAGGSAHDFKVSVNPTTATVTALFVHVVNGDQHEPTVTRMGTSHLFAFSVASGILDEGPHSLRVTATLNNIVQAVAEIELTVE